MRARPNIVVADITRCTHSERINTGRSCSLRYSPFPNFNYQEFIKLLNEIDNQVIKGNIREFDEEFLYYFNQIMSYVNDNYVVDEKLGTLGHSLIENALITKQKLTPTLIMYFYLEQKEKANLTEYCNHLYFGGTGFSMAIKTNEDLPLYCEISHKHYDKEEDVDKYNYAVMHDILHEIAHIYQQTREETSPNLLEQLTFYDNLCGRIVTHELLGGNTGLSLFAHESLIIEQTAEEQANIAMIALAEKHPEYFNKEIISFYKNGHLDRISGKPYNDPRAAFDYYINMLLKETYYNGNKEQIDYIDSIIRKITEIKMKMIPIIDKLKLQGISDKSEDLKYNIYLHSLYSFGNDGLVIKDNKKINESRNDI